MIKTIALAHRNPELSREEFSRYWHEQHGPMAARMLPGLKKYVQNHFLTVPGEEFEGDGIVEMWYDDIAAWQNSMKFMQTPEGHPLVEDGMKFARMQPGGHWIVEEHVIMDKMK